MEIDLVDEQASQSLPQPQQKGRPAQLVDDDHPFDLDAYIASYNGEHGPSSSNASQLTIQIKRKNNC